MPSIPSHCISLLALCLSFSVTSSAQETVEGDEEIPVAVVETLPAWEGCRTSGSDANEEARLCTERAISNFVVSNLTYPKKARRKGIEGRVIVKFIVEKDGTIGEVVVVKGVHPMLDEEAHRVVESMPAFQPGMQRGKAVRVSYHLPFNFALN